MRLTLQTRLLLLIAGTVAGLAVIVLGALNALTRREIDRSVRVDVQTTGNVLAHFISERSVLLRDQSLLLARQPALMMNLLGRSNVGAESGAAPDFATISDCLREWLPQLHADAAVMTDADGRVLGDTDAATRPMAPSQEAGIEAAMQGEIWSGVVLRKERLMLAISVPILEPVSKYVKGTFTAYGAIDMQVAVELKRALGSEVAFVHHGQVVGASLPLPTRLPTPQNDPELVILNRTTYFALYAPLPNSDPQAGIGFATLRSYNQAMARYSRLRFAFVAVSLVTLLLALAAGATVAKGITRPLDGLVKAATTLREGGWPEPFAVQRNDELGLLQTVFNEMTSAMRASQERLLAMIDVDPLTGLDNHRQFQERLEQETIRCKTSGEALSLVLFDLDHFQQYNQRHGHAAGDEALKQIAAILQDCLPEVAILSRFAGEKFAALLPQQGLDQSEEMAEKVREVTQQTRDKAGMPELTLSAGCAEFGTQTSQAEGLVLAAELAVSQAKQLGRNRVCRFDSMPGADENADPYQMHRFLQDGSFATIQALAAAVDAKDPYTQGHSRRVAEYASELARYAGLPTAEVELIYTTGTLHDVGKIGVPDAILKKPGRLDDEERAIMETHPVLGEVIVRKAPQLAATLPGVRHHHERWDGKGYPDNLAGEDIPRMARILAVADTFDAMTSDRPYRKGLELDVALEEIAKGAGTQFDPDFAPAFVAMMQEKGALAKAA